jgi:GLPGLI family protein
MLINNNKQTKCCKRKPFSTNFLENFKLVYFYKNYCKMKKYILLSFLLCVNILSSQVTGKVIYRISIDSPIGNDNDEKYKFVKSLEEVAAKFELKLLFSKGKSSYKLTKPMKMNLKEEALFNLAEIVFKAKGEFFTYIKQKKIIEQKDFGGEIFLIEKKLDVSDWKLINEEKLIGGYICYKAVRTYVYESRKGSSSLEQVVWYSPQISLPFGPAEFCGFPGLVLSVKSGNIIFNAEIINLNSNTTIENLNPLKGKKVSEKEFKRIAKKSRENLMRN